MNTYLQHLVNFSLSGTSRAADMECLKFTGKRSGDKKEQLPGFALHLQCIWRITSDQTLLVGSLDLYEPADDNKFDDGFDWDKPGSNLRDRRLTNMLSCHKLVVQSVDADNFGGFTIRFKNGFTFSTFITASRQDNFSEYWRLIDNRGDRPKHFVVSYSTLNDGQYNG